MTRLLKLSACFALVAALTGGTTVEAQNATVISSSRHNASTKSLRDIVRDAPVATQLGAAPYAVPNKFHIEKQRAAEGETVNDPVRQGFSGSLAPSIGVNFEGSSDADNSALFGFAVVPPDTDGDVGLNHYVQWINLVSEIFDKNGVTLLGPFAGNDYFSGLGGDCDAQNNGDPITLYDEAADRWLVSQFAVDTSPFSMCVAISQTSDPTGAYNQYEFDFGTDFPDYPKLGIWGDSYTMTTRDFADGAFFAGLSAVVLDRDAMLNGDPATMVRFANAFGGTSIDGYLPADADDVVSGPAVFGGHGDDGDTTFELWELDVDWTDPGAATFTSISGVTVSAFDGVVPSVNQPNGQLLDDHSFFTMHRLVVRDFGTHMSMVANHTVETDPGTAGIRWYEFRDTGSGWSLHQEGTYSPDTEDRWMGSIAMNGNGDISLGYSQSSSTQFPSIYFTGQTADQSGTGVMNVAETLVHAGAGSQSGASRWGDYSKMAVDPSDDNTFWYTTEYYETTSSFNFKTRIASLNLDDGGGGNNPPTASFTSSCTLLDCDFTDTSSDTDGTVVSWDWDFGDTNTSTVQNPSHTYGANGTYTVMLTVADDMGATGSTSQSVTVDDGAGGSTMHVDALSDPVLVRSGGSGFAEATVTIVDDGGSPVEGATVTGMYDGDVSGMPSAVTDENGEAVLVSDDVFTRPTTIDICVVDVTHGTLTYDPADNADPAFSCDDPPPPPDGDFTHVDDITTIITRDANRDGIGRATVIVLDENGIPVPAATVSGTFSGDVTGTPSAVTDTFGEAVLDSDPAASRPSTADFCVDDITHASLTYDPGANEDPAFDCSGAAPSAAKGATAASLSTVFEFSLSQNFPNPFYGASLITYQLAEATPVRLKVYNTIGQEVATLVDTYQDSGSHTVAFDASELSAGLYLYVIEAGDYRATRRMTLLR